jgi:hypothetical protein
MAFQSIFGPGLKLGLVLVASQLGFSAAAAEFYNYWASNQLVSVPAQSGATNDPDADGVPNIVEFVLGTNPLVAGDTAGSIRPVLVSPVGTLEVQVYEQGGIKPGVQMDLSVSADLAHWVHPWWLRTVTNSLPTDASGSAREVFSTRMPGTNRVYIRCRADMVEAGPEVARYYVATNGSDSNAGTNTDKPFATLGKAVGLANPGDLIYVRGGTYPLSGKVSFSRSGAPGQPIRVRAYPGENPVFNSTATATGTDTFSLSGNCWWLYGLETTNSGHNGIRISGASNIIERCVVHHSRNTGIHISGSLTTGYNLVLNCDSYMNYDAAGNGQDADGFSAKWIIGLSNVFRGCRSWYNSDDGWDLWMATNAVTIENCWAFLQGFNIFGDTNWQGNGNGFKLGGNYVSAPHRMSHCLAFRNAVNGVDQNNNLAGQTIDHNTSWGNYGANYALNHGTNTTPHTIRNNISITGAKSNSFRTGSKLTNNSWQVFSSVTANDLLSVNTNFALLPRQANGDLPESPFLRLPLGGRFIDAGVKTGEPYKGAAPDLGAYEVPGWQD